MNRLDVAAALAAAALAAAFLAAAKAKAMDRVVTADAFKALGVPRPGVVAVALPVVEVLVAVALVLSPTVGATAAMALLLAFTTFLVGRLRQGIHVPCPCFGSTGQRAISATTVARNGVLMAIAVGVVVVAPAARPPLVLLSVSGSFVIVRLGARRGRRADSHPPQG